MLLLVTAAYVVMGKFGLMLAFFHPSASPVWPPTGLSIAALLLLGYRQWPAILLGAFLVNVTTTGSIGTSAGIAAGNTLEALTAWYLLERYAGGVRVFERVNGVLAFTFLAAIGATLVSATIGVATLVLGGLVSAESAAATWFTWWLGDMVGALIVTPLLVLWTRETHVTWDMRRAAEALAVLAAVALIGTIVFSNLLFSGGWHHSLVYLSLLPGLWAAIRFGPRETVSVVFLLSCIAIAGTLAGQGPFVRSSANSSLVLLQSFTGTISVIGLLLAAALREMKAFEASLELTIEERTHELALAREHDRANLERLRNMIDRMPLGAVACDENLKILHINERLLRIFHLDSGSPFPLTVADMFQHARDVFVDPQASVASILQLLGSREQTLGCEIQLQEDTVLSCDHIPVTDQSVERGHLLLFRDVTEERRIDKAKSEFVSLASHQLRTPLTAVRWSFGKLDRQLRELIGEQERKLISMGKQASARMCETIDTMLSIARIESRQFSLRPADVRLCDVLEETAAPYREHCAERKQILLVSCDHPSLSVHTDARLLREILSTLLNNAMKYTPAGGSISLHASTTDAQNVRIDVTDTGIGIPPHEQEHVFLKFFRGRRARGVDQDGTGLGLYFASMASKMLGSRLSFTSTPGAGTTFSLLLHASTAHMPSHAPLQETAAARL